MNEWIEINLPWDCYIDYDNQPKAPDLSDKEKIHFGNCEKELFIEWRIKELESELDLEIDKALINNTYSHLTVKNTTNSPKYAKLAEFRKLQRDRESWDNEQSEFKEYSLALKKFYHDHAQKSFTGRELDKPGTLVEFADGKQILVGSYNDFCIEPDEIVKKYKIIWIPEK